MKQDALGHLDTNHSVVPRIVSSFQQFLQVLDAATRQKTLPPITMTTTWQKAWLTDDLWALYGHLSIRASRQYRTRRYEYIEGI